ncbi:MAG TPA: VWA containing CoxE family protein, partial [Acidimicrobiia bacterium]|nr:VWA containing CoxE family protein [Acidimicrobiia bacterium]
VIFTGDARNNHRMDDAGLAILRRIHDRSKQVYWLNPESRGDWGDEDSLMPEFKRFCTGVYEVRNLNQLQEFVLEIA